MIKKKISRTLRKYAGYEWVHITFATVGLYLIMCSAGYVIEDYNPTLSIVCFLIGAPVFLHALWFLDEILDAFNEDKAN